jgi:Ca2+-binding RTX toxin-like protein
VATILYNQSGFDVLKLNFGRIFDGDSYLRLSNRFVVDFGNDYRDEYRGSGITYSLFTGEPTGGTVSTYSYLYAPNTVAVQINGLNLPAFKISAAALTSSTADDYALIELMLAGSDSFFGSGGADTFDGRAGNDSLKGSGGSDSLRGHTGNDTLDGQAGNDVMNGGAGADTLKGALGKDTSTGGLGNDRFVFGNTPSAANTDVIVDFHNTPGDNDAFHLDNATFAALGVAGGLNSSLFWVGAAAHDANDRIVYNKATGALYYDTNGNAAGGTYLIATIQNKPTLTFADIVVI